MNQKGTATAREEFDKEIEEYLKAFLKAKRCFEIDGFADEKINKKYNDKLWRCVEKIKLEAKLELARNLIAFGESYDLGSLNPEKIIKELKEQLKELKG